AWGLTLFAREANAGGRVGPARLALAAAVGACLLGAGAMLWSAWAPGMDPTVHVYPAIVWAILIWTAFHIGIGVVMLLYCLAGSLFGKLTPQHDADIQNVSLFWHFLLATVLVTALTVGPVARMM
ncbi:MAG TPA: cytochrome ubiquinol oxidase subunit I, partial [Paracoccaceae bacterium]|nr:cytochrome ubiquinol oxidase subunit I [Paracoccaceae bacterium]